MKRVAITGGIGSGKSTVAKQIALLGFSVFSCDEIYKEVLEDKAYIAQISRVFDGVVKEGEIDKKALANLVFSSETQRKRLNSIAHPIIMDRLYAHMDSCADELVFAEVPLLFEGGYEKDFDFVIVVNRDIEKRIESVMRRDGVDRSSVLDRLRVQYDYKNIKSRKVYFLNNDGEVAKINPQLKNILYNIKNAKI